MAYAEGRRFYDADSHIMELPDYLRAHADPSVRDRLPEIATSHAVLGNAADVAVRGAHAPEQVEKMVAMGDQLISGPKGYFALGAFNRQERSTALDQLGFDRQLVFPTFAAGAAFFAKDPDVMYGGALAHNRAMAEFCADDDRLMGVGTMPLEDPARACRELEKALELGLEAIWIPHRPCGGRSPGHDDLDPFWAHLAEAGVPFVLHVGGSPLQLDPAWMNTGRKIPTDWLGGGENVRGKDMGALHHEPEKFLSALVLDGVLERHPKLRGGAIELGAGWVPSMLTRLDYIADIWKKSERELAQMTRKPSQQVREQLAFTPFVYEDVGELIRQSSSDLYLFSSDYPHNEGGRNPLGRFGRSLEGFEEPALEQFYSGNFAELFGL